MSDPVWYRSLYWKIAFGFIAMLAVLLLSQVLLFLWLTDRIFAAVPRTPAQLATMVADEVGAEIQQRPDIDLEAFVRDRFSHIYQPFLVVTDHRAARVESTEWLAAGIQSIRTGPPSWRDARQRTIW